MKKAGFKLKPLEVEAPIMAAIYGSVVKDMWRVLGRDVVANYPPHVEK